MVNKSFQLIACLLIMVATASAITYYEDFEGGIGAWCTGVAGPSNNDTLFAWTTPASSCTVNVGWSTSMNHSFSSRTISGAAVGVQQGIIIGDNTGPGYCVYLTNVIAGCASGNCHTVASEHFAAGDNTTIDGTDWANYTIEFINTTGNHWYRVYANWGGGTNTYVQDHECDFSYGNNNTWFIPQTAGYNQTIDNVCVSSTAGECTQDIFYPSSPSADASASNQFPFDDDNDNNITTWKYYIEHNTTVAPSNASLYLNNSYVTSNASAIVNASNNSFTHTPAEGQWDWYVSIDMNDTSILNTSEFTFVYDTTGPTVVVVTPVDGTSYVRGALPDFEAYAEDNNLLNSTDTIYWANNGSALEEHQVNAGGATIIYHNHSVYKTLIGDFYYNVTAMDSHTDTKVTSTRDKSTEKTNEFKFTDSQASFTFTSTGLPANRTKSYSLETDRHEFGYIFTAIKDQIYTDTIVSTKPIYEINSSSYDCHLITGRSWIDYDDDTGTQKCKIKSVSGNRAVVEYWYNLNGLITSKPATGGLNFASDNVSYSVTAYPTSIPLVWLNDTTPTLTETVQAWAYYNYTTNGTAISGANCTLNVWNSIIGNTTYYNMGEQDGGYQENHTFTVAGEHIFHVDCSLTDFDDANNQTTETIQTTALANQGINLNFNVDDVSDYNVRFTNTTCTTDNWSVYHSVNKSAMVTGDNLTLDAVMAVGWTEYCEYGCVNGGTTGAYCKPEPTLIGIYLIVGIAAFLMIIAFLARR